MVIGNECSGYLCARGTKCYYKCQTLEIYWDRSSYYSIYLNTDTMSIDDNINMTYTIKSNYIFMEYENSFI